MTVRRGRCRRGLQSSRRRGTRSRGGVSGLWEAGNEKTRETVNEVIRTTYLTMSALRCPRTEPSTSAVVACPRRSLSDDLRGSTGCSGEERSLSSSSEGGGGRGSCLVRGRKRKEMRVAGMAGGGGGGEEAGLGIEYLFILDGFPMRSVVFFDSFVFDVIGKQGSVWGSPLLPRTWRASFPHFTLPPERTNSSTADSGMEYGRLR